MVSEQPIFIVDASEEAIRQIHAAFNSAVIRNPIESFATLQACLERLEDCSKQRVELCPVMIMVSASFTNQLKALAKLSANDSPYPAIPIILHGEKGLLPGALPEGIRASLELPIRLDKLVAVLGKLETQWMLRTPE